MNDVIRATTALNKAPGKLEWRVLIVDMQSMKMVSACTKMHELSAEGITSKLELTIRIFTIPVPQYSPAPTKLVPKYDNYVVYLIAVVETIEKRREPLPAMEAIYLITPNEKTIKELMSDFQSQHRTQYRAAHVYFTEGKFEYDASCQLNGKMILANNTLWLEQFSYFIEFQLVLINYLTICRSRMPQNALQP